jgi:hypothetical protein
MNKSVKNNKIYKKKINNFKYPNFIINIIHLYQMKYANIKLLRINLKMVVLNIATFVLFNRFGKIGKLLALKIPLASIEIC